MSKNVKILIGLILVSSFLVLYLVLSSNTITVKQSDKEKADIAKQKIDLTAVAVNHKEKITKIITETDIVAGNLAASGSSTAGNASANNAEDMDKNEQKIKIENLKNNLASLKAPSEKFGKMHINLILALTNFEKYLDLNDDNLLKEGLSSLDVAKKEYKQYYP